MAVADNGRVEFFQGNRVRPGGNNSLIDKISWFEQQTSGRKPDRDDAPAETGERMQSSACFEAWAIPDPDLFGRH